MLVLLRVEHVGLLHGACLPLAEFKGRAPGSTKRWQASACSAKACAGQAARSEAGKAKQAEHNKAAIEAALRTKKLEAAR